MAVTLEQCLNVWPDKFKSEMITICEVINNIDPAWSSEITLNSTAQWELKIYIKFGDFKILVDAFPDLYYLPFTGPNGLVKWLNVKEKQIIHMVKGS